MLSCSGHCAGPPTSPPPLVTVRSPSDSVTWPLEGHPVSGPRQSATFGAGFSPRASCPEGGSRGACHMSLPGVWLSHMPWRGCTVHGVSAARPLRDHRSHSQPSSAVSEGAAHIGNGFPSGRQPSSSGGSGPGVQLLGRVFSLLGCSVSMETAPTWAAVLCHRSSDPASQHSSRDAVSSPVLRSGFPWGCGAVWLPSAFPGGRPWGASGSAPVPAALPVATVSRLVSCLFAD